MASSTSADAQQAHVRHWPLDLPELPFERYEHRRLVARDILVHRIMDKIVLHPTDHLARACEHSRLSDPTRLSAFKNFGRIKYFDRALGRDVELLRKMLTTCSAAEPLWDPVKKPVSRIGPHRRIHTIQDNDVASINIGEEIVDLVRRHYLEMDDPSLRLWLQAIQPPSHKSWNNLSRVPEKPASHRAASQRRRLFYERSLETDDKKWYPEDVERLKSLQNQTRVANSLHLYDGVAFLPTLRQRLHSSRHSRIKHVAMRVKRADAPEIWSIIYNGDPDWVFKKAAYPWPEADEPRRALHIASWRNFFHRRAWFRAEESHPVEFASGRAGRGLDRDGIWSTYRWHGVTEERGRNGRGRRRRASSEPPPDMFSSARLPSSFGRPREVLVFPKMTLATMDRRSRRRSLSRTRIAEMFDWNVFPSKTPQAKEQHLGGLGSIARSDDARRGSPGEETSAMRNDQAPDSPRAPPAPKPPSPCANCTSTAHLTSQCDVPCGYCGAPNPNISHDDVREVKLGYHYDTDSSEDALPAAGQHLDPHLAPNCPVARHNRCKCTPFPQFHVAAKCSVPCSRDCGNHERPGHFKHRSAMLCRARCCMCGIRGHSGGQCRLRRCRCGGAHLGQDCGWKPECGVRGCDRFLCGLHCAGCGRDRREMADGVVFVRRRCPGCFEGGAGGGENAHSQDMEGDNQDVQALKGQDGGPAKKGGGRARRQRKTPEEKEREKARAEKAANLPWYAPLQPRTRPVASKSGKKARKR